MPAVSTVAFDGLLHRGAEHSSSAPNSHHLSLQTRRDGTAEGAPPPRRNSSSSFSYYISSPALYVAPEPAQLAGSSAAMCVSPSPYVVNHKRREWPAAAAPPPCAGPVAPEGRAESNGHGQVADSRQITGTTTAAANSPAEEGRAADANACNGLETKTNGLGKQPVVEEGEPAEEDVDDFFNPKAPGDSDTSETEEGSVGFSLRRVPDPNTPMLNQSEFYDASEDFFSDISGAQPPRLLELESDLRSVRLNLFEEIERRKKTEESLLHMKNEWRKMAACFSQVGLTLPPIPSEEDANGGDAVLESCREFVITRLVSEAFVRDLAQAEADAFTEAVIESKNREISRLYDRMQYYEAVNHEMSQRNQEEKALRRSQKRRLRQRLLWGCIGLSIAIGGSLLVHSYLSSPGSGSTSSEPVDRPFEPSPDAVKPTPTA